MPTYEYACKDCNTHIEVVQRFTDDPLTECHACGGRLRKVFGSIGITFKGSGFYRTDSRPAGGTGSGGSGTDKSPDKSGTDKPAAEKKSAGKGSDKATTSGDSSSSGSSGSGSTAKSA